MKTYSDEFKSAIIGKMLAPNNVGVSQLSKETGIPKDTLYTWRIKGRRSLGSEEMIKAKTARQLTSEDKFNIVVETASLNESETSEYCRRNGLYPDQISTWRRQCLKANESGPKRVDPERFRQQEKENLRLKAELRRKEKALAETAALLVLKKKAQEIWGDPEDDK